VDNESGARRERLVVMATRVEFLDPPPADVVNRRAEATAPTIQTARSGAVAPATPRVEDAEELSTTAELRAPRTLVGV
jgi:hypothetical protein